MKTLFIFCFFALVLTDSLAQSKANKPRTIITTDGEIDDVDSFIRMLLYSNEFKIEGLIYSSSMWHYKGDGKGTKMVSEMAMTKDLYGEKADLRWAGEYWMQDLIASYAKVYPFLIQNAKGYPTAASLMALIKVGNIDFEGEMDHDTEGSNFIKAKLLDATSSPLYLQAWGGTNTIARALKSIEDEYQNTSKWAEISKKVANKAIIYTILDQDATYKKYISIHWPNIKIYYNAHQFWCLAYPWKKAVDVSLHPLFEGKFMGEKIINNHGPLTKMYYSYGDGQKQVGDDEHIHGDSSKLSNGQWGTFKPYDFISEGDSPAFLHLVDVGLDNLQSPQFGGWGGRLQQSKSNSNRWEDGDDVSDYNPFTKKIDLAYPQTRWLEAIQNDFAARADWCIMPYKNANHAPIIKLNLAKKNKAKPHARIALSASAHDPDANKLSYHWWQYREVGTYKGEIAILNQDQQNASFIIPHNIKPGETIHIILSVTDDAKTPITRYKRIIITSQ